MRPVKEQKRILRKLTEFRMTLEITSSNGRAQFLSKPGRCPAKQRDPREKPKINEATRTRLNDHSDGDICRVMLGATYNDMAGEFGGCGPVLLRTG